MYIYSQYPAYHITVLSGLYALSKSYTYHYSYVASIIISMYVYLGMLSKSRGQILRIAATMHVMFHMNTPQVIPQTISESALKAALNFVEVCNQHLAYLSGRGRIEDAIDAIIDIQKGAYISTLLLVLV